MNTFQLDCFLTVAETLNFARAAEQLNITQPAVTHQIRSLESELNVKLFKRTTRTVELTSAGHLFLNDAQSIVSISIRAKKRFENPSHQDIQLFSIGCHNHAVLFYLTDILKALKTQFPFVHPLLRIVPFQHLYRSLEEEDIDAIIGFQEPEKKKISATYKEIQKIPIVCACSIDNPLASREKISLEELAQEKLVLIEPNKLPADINHLQVRLMDKHPPSDFYFSPSAETASVLVKANYGIAVLPQLLIQPASDLQCIVIEDTAPISFGIYYKTLQDNVLLKSFVNLLTGCFGQ